jgi:hypothetical protein
VTGAIAIGPSGTLTDELDSGTSDVAIMNYALFITVEISVFAFTGAVRCLARIGRKPKLSVLSP